MAIKVIGTTVIDNSRNIQDKDSLIFYHFI